MSPILLGARAEGLRFAHIRATDPAEEHMPSRTVFGIAGEPMKLDRFDVKILAMLQSQGRLSNSRLAEGICLSSSATWARVQRLEQGGLIRAYHADVAVELLPQMTVVIVPLTLENHHASDFKRFEQFAQGVHEIVECHAVGGGVDYVLRVITQGLEQYQQLMDRMLEASLGIERYWSYIVTKSVKPFAGYPVEQLLRSESSDSKQDC